jgi:hypothetical protein
MNFSFRKEVCVNMISKICSVMLFLFLLFLFSFAINNLASASFSNGTIEFFYKNTKICLNTNCANFSAVNWRPTLNSSTSGANPVVITDNGMSGNIWGDAIGWVNLRPTTSGVNVNPQTGQLSGFAYSGVGSWINFNPTYSGTGPAVGVSILSDGSFYGYAWVSGMNGGWMKFDCADPSICIKTDWRPIPNRPSGTGGVLLSGGGGGGGGGTTTTSTTATAEPKPEVKVISEPTLESKEEVKVGEKKTVLPKKKKIVLPPSTLGKTPQELLFPGLSLPKIALPLIKGESIDDSIYKDFVFSQPEGRATFRASPQKVTIGTNDIPFNLDIFDGFVKDTLRVEIKNKPGKFINDVNLNFNLEKDTNAKGIFSKKVYTRKTILDRFRSLFRGLKQSMIPVAYAAEEISIFQKDFSVPEGPGLYNLRAQVMYDDGTTSYRDYKVAFREPGVIFSRLTYFLYGEKAVKEGKVILYKKDVATDSFEPFVHETNPQILDEGGTYQFVVPKGEYKLIAGAKGYYSGEIYYNITEEPGILNDSIELECIFTQSFSCLWDIKLIVIVSILLFMEHKSKDRKDTFSWEQMKN